MSICIIYMISVWSLNISIYIDIDIQYLISMSLAYRYHLYISMSSIPIHDVCIHQHIAAMHGRTWPMYITPEESLLLTLGQLEADNKTCEAMALATWGYWYEMEYAIWIDIRYWQLEILATLVSRMGAKKTVEYDRMRLRVFLNEICWYTRVTNMRSVSERWVGFIGPLQGKHPTYWTVDPIFASPSDMWMILRRYFLLPLLPCPWFSGEWA